MKVEKLNIDIRTRNGLWSAGIYDIEDLSLWTAKELTAIPNFGGKSFVVLIDALAKENLCFIGSGVK
jgi:DNA-directed RNA polymerase alpha subunit